MNCCLAFEAEINEAFKNGLPFKNLALSHLLLSTFFGDKHISISRANFSISGLAVSKANFLVSCANHW